MKEYLYDVFLSFTGLDRSLKASIRKYLESQGLDCYDSDEINTGDFRDHYCEGIDKSRVYLLVLTDSLYNDPAKTGKGFISEVRKEVNLALEWKVWDYSHTPLNLWGQICLPFSLLWFAVCIPVCAVCSKMCNGKIRRE